MKYAEIFECKCEGPHPIEVLGHWRVPSLVLTSELASHELEVNEDPNVLYPEFLASFNPASKASYSKWLLVALNKKRRAYLMTTPSKFVKIKWLCFPENLKRHQRKGSKSSLD